MSHRIFQSASDKYNIDITITLDYEPEGFEYQMILYDKNNRLLGIAKNNGSGGKSITIPNWCMKDDAYTLRVQTKEGKEVISEEDYNLVFQENKLGDTYLRMYEKMNFNFVLQRKLNEKYFAVPVREMTPQRLRKYEENYIEQMELYNETTEFYA